MAAEHGTTGRAAPTAPPVGAAPGSGQAPRLADGVELLGEYQNSGYSQPPSLVRRPDGQVIQMSPLLYRVICRIDGSRDVAAIAERVSEDLGRSLHADQVRYLITAKLLPLGVVVAKGAPAAAPTANPLLALRARGRLLPERAANAAGTLLRPLFRWPVVVAVLGSVLAGIYSATSAEVLLLIHRHHAPGDAGAADAVRPLRRLLHPERPCRVPDLFARAAPILRSAVGKGPKDPRITGMRRRARIVVTGWVLCVIPLLILSLGTFCCTCPKSIGRCGVPDGAGRVLERPRPVPRLVARSPAEPEDSQARPFGEYATKP